MRTYPLTFNEFKQGLAEGKLPGLTCRECGEGMVPPSAVCASCGGTELQEKDFGKKGRIRTFTIIRVGPAGYDVPYAVGLVELEEGPWVLGNLLGIDADREGLDLIDREVTVSSRVLPADPAEAGIEGVVLTFEPVRNDEENVA